MYTVSSLLQVSGGSELQAAVVYRLWLSVCFATCDTGDLVKNFLVLVLTFQARKVSTVLGTVGSMDFSCSCSVSVRIAELLQVLVSIWSSDISSLLRL